MKTVLILNKGKYSAVQDKNSGFDMLACKNQVFLSCGDSNRVTAPYSEQNSCAAAKEHGNRAVLQMYGRLNTIKYIEGKR